MSESKPDPFVGKTLDGYKIGEIIGRGGMGTVYKATQLSLGRPIALKVLTADLASDKQFLERFRREADVLSKLSHPNIVTVFDRGEIDGRPYLAMEYIEGTSLRDILRRGPCEPQEALRIVSSVLSALSHAHEKGIVHRDIKPENVLLSRGDVVKVADFGLSRLIDTDQTRLTRTHLVLGTYEYMAPEQRERSREADHRSDLYATGVILYEMLTGELPIGRFHMPSDQRDDCDSRIDQLIERSLAKSPEHRYQNADEMAGAVSQILDRPSEPGIDLPEPRRDGEAKSAKGYRPVRFEYHADNVATFDHVLGTLFYALGFLALFGFLRSAWFGLPFFAFFIAGWYLRETAEELRKFKRSARTSQAVVAILCGFTGLLLPFTIYSLWVLFGHKGRTYYEARSRGLGAREAAQYTYRLLEEPYSDVPGPRPEPAPVEPLRPTPPTPSQIPIQSMVTSEVLPKPVHRKQRTRLVTAGIWVAGLTLIAGLIAVASDARLASDEIETPLIVGIAVSGSLLGLGVLRVFTGRGFTGLIPAAITGFGLVVACVGFDEIKHDRARQNSLLVQRSARLGSYATMPARGFEDSLLKDSKVVAWLSEACAYPNGQLGREVRFRRRGKTVWVEVPYRVAIYDRMITINLAAALRELLKNRLGPDFIATQARMPSPVRDYMLGSPVPIAAD